MRQNGQHLIKYSGITFDSVMRHITTDWEGAYFDCRIVSISIVDGGHGLYHAAVVYEELSKVG